MAESNDETREGRWFLFNEDAPKALRVVFINEGGEQLPPESE